MPPESSTEASVQWQIQNPHHLFLFMCMYIYTCVPVEVCAHEHGVHMSMVAMVGRRRHWISQSLSGRLL